MSSEKRARGASESYSSSQLVKRQKPEANLGNSAVSLVNGSAQNGALVQAVPRSSSLQSQVMQLNGHSGEVFATRFSRTGEYIASGSMDRSILLWHTYGDCENFGSLTGHKGAVLDIQWSRDSRVLYSASADMTLASWDLETGTRIRRHEGHEEVINSMDVTRRGEEILVSGSDDGFIGIWDPRQKQAIDFIEVGLPVISVALAEAGNELYSGGIDNDIKVWDMRRKTVAYTLIGHTDTVTSLEVSPDAQFLLSNSHDSTVKKWDIRPFAPQERLMQSYDGAPLGMEKNLLKACWDTNGQRVAAGSGDRSVVVWDANSGKLLHKLPGHKGAVNDVRFSPREESIIVSGSSDRTLMLGELGV